MTVRGAVSVVSGERVGPSKEVGVPSVGPLSVLIGHCEVTSVWSISTCDPSSSPPPTDSGVKSESLISGEEASFVVASLAPASAGNLSTATVTTGRTGHWCCIGPSVGSIAV